MLRNANEWKQAAASAEEVVSHIKSGMNVFLHGGCATPAALVDALARRKDIEGVKLFHLHTEGTSNFASREQAPHVRSVSLFAGAMVRRAIEEGHADYVPVFLSDIPDLFESGGIRLDAALLQVSPPNAHGHCSLGTSIDVAKAAADAAPLLLCEINERMPRTHGNSVVPFSRITAHLHSNRPLYQHQLAPESEVEARIGEIIADLVEDRSCLQMGIGAIPDAVLTRLKGKRDLGVHTEMFSDRFVELFESGAVTNRYKEVGPSRTITSFVIGTQKVFDFVDDNPLVEFHPSDRTNDTSVIRKNERVVAINSALQVDLSGQVCADSLGHRIYSGIGGQMDFMRGAALSKGGKPILAFSSTAANGTISRITHELNAGAGVVTTRGHVHWIVTEYGAVNLHGRSLRERGEALISIAHPDFRPELRRQLNAIRHFSC